MKNLLKITTLLIATLLIISCSDDNDDPTPTNQGEQNTTTQKFIGQWDGVTSNEEHGSFKVQYIISDTQISIEFSSSPEPFYTLNTTIVSSTDSSITLANGEEITINITQQGDDKNIGSTANIIDPTRNVNTSVEIEE